MPLQTSGQMALSDIMRETGMSSVSSYSLDNGENGQTNVGYPKINLCSPMRPSDNDGCSLSEWRGYDHYITCNTYRWTAVYNDSNPNICNENPTNPPSDTPAITTSCVEKAALNTTSCVCIGMDPQLYTPISNGYDGRSGRLLFLNYYNNVYNLKVYTLGGSLLWTQPAGIYVNGSYDFSGLGGNTAYLISYTYFCGSSLATAVCTTDIVASEATKVVWAGNMLIGSLNGAVTYFSQTTTGTAACATTNQIRIVYYNISSTTNSADVGTTFYTDSSQTVTAPAGAYVMANGKKYIVNSSGIITSIEASCTANPDMFGRYFRRSAFQMKNVSYTGITIGNCYILQNYTNQATNYVRGVVSSHNINTGEVTMIIYSYP